ncbi:MAG TPA: phosphatase PAP2 family protein [Kineosporiaceae bacterium]|nr:phosphatase PAP2 family protein [Kineosporiaceae bacterium]
MQYAMVAVALLLGPFTALTTLVVLTAPGVFFVDADVAGGLHGFVLDRPALATALRVLGLITLPDTFRVIALVSAGLLWWRGRRRVAAWLLVTMGIGGALGVMLKQVFARSRPEWPESITVASGYSYPSGHALNSMLAAGCAIVLLDQIVGPAGRRLFWTAAAGLVLLVGLDRIALGVHYLTDVLAGWTLALAVLFTTLAAFDPFTAPGATGPPGRARGTRGRSTAKRADYSSAQAGPGE